MNNPTNPTNETPDLSPLAQDLIHAEAPDEALKALLNELEEAADELRTELEARGRKKQQLNDDSVDEGQAAVDKQKHKKINPNVTPEQEAELEHFPEYWANSKGSWKNLFQLLREFRAEMREGKNHA
ncbi:hypothetical protein [Corynebacterium sp. Marseille-P4321]|uniref:hypothetical protein n=1 Tax=Corynebacterium sp. Marseille-P4321 TaxID=2736603 RepID=UPI001589FED2|nr:hypothetical protein [Corynebacterium sp. Marseille-P4321]